ncbi:MAG: efflux RND transporter permease subunit [Betaproteobacteria bacterium]|nr:efflux RND transporter permease subunit [Betaproteobacteria bacterium]
MLKRFNLSEWALRHQGFVLYCIVALGLIGAFSYERLGQSEDPPFTFKVMVVRTQWPGATAREVEQQITEKIERKLQETPNVDFLRSYSRPGESQIFVIAKDTAPSTEMGEMFYQVRKKVGDIRNTLPDGVRGPFFNDEFGDTFGNIFALTGDGYTYAELKEHAERLRRDLLRLPDVAKVDLIGEQDEKIYVEMSNTKLATLGVDVSTILGILQQQNSMVPAGAFETPTDKIFLRVSGDFDSLESIRELAIRGNNRTFRLGDIASVYRGFVDPPQPRMRFMGKEALGLGVSMKKGGDIVTLGKNLDREVERLEKNLPIGLDFARVNDQPRAVRASISEFVRSVAEAVTIVLAVSFISLGLRTGMVVALSIPLVLALTFLLMYVFDIGLHKISLGALVLSLGLLVDDAIIAVEMMAVKMEQGMDRMKAASFAFTSTAFPMLTGTLVTAAGFLPIATAKSSTGEYTRALFQVTSIALLVSWVAAVIVIPYLGNKLLPDFHEHTATRRPRWLGSVAGPLHRIGERISRLTRSFLVRFRRAVEWCVTWRKTVLAATVAAFALSLAGFGLVQQQFFPASTRLELLVDLKLPEGSSIAATEREVRKLEAVLAADTRLIENYVAYVGSGTPRFYLPIDQQLPTASFAQFVITTNTIGAREALRVKLIGVLDGPDFTGLRGRVLRLENGPPVGFPIQFRVSGEDIEQVRALAGKVSDTLRKNANLSNVQFDWNEKSKVVRLEIDQAKARVLGISSQDLSAFLNTSLNGLAGTSFREKDKLIEVVLRGDQQERARLELMENLAVPTRSGKAVPLAQIARLTYDFEEGVIWRRNRLPTITVRADIYGDLQADTVVKQLDAGIAALRAQLPPGYRLELGGAVEESAKGGSSIVAGVPLLIFVVLTVLMIQLQSFQRVIMVVLTAPLGLIGVTIFLLAFNKPFGFVAMLGTIALSGMIMRNSVILIDQIEQDIAAGHPAWNAIIDSTVRRFRPIVLTALAAILAMIPLTRSVFFGPMAVAIMGGLFVATVLTLLFLPALYAAWFRVKKPLPDAA